MSKYLELDNILNSLEKQLIGSKLWSKTRPSVKDLQSSQPFCHDTLKPEQWLQFVFIAKLRQMIQLSLPLPANCDITPYFAESLKQHKDVDKITAITANIDKLLSK